jgi:hypothetical protein
MKYTIYQFPFPETKEQENIFINYAYRSLDSIDYVHPEYYEEVYSGEINRVNGSDYETLEELFKIFNINHPEDFHGHSLSVSDIVKLDDTFYFCDDLGWDKIDFNK